MLSRFRPSGAPPTGVRLALALIVAAAAGTRAFHFAARSAHGRDFDQVWFAARALLAGADPYALIGPGRAFDWEAPFFYPLPAALLGVPFAPLTRPVADAAFAALGAGLLAWVLLRRSYVPLLLVASYPLAFAVEAVQWSPLLAASLGLPWLGMAYAAKPTIGAALLVARPSWWAVLGGGALLAVSFLLQPTWVADWRGALQGAAVGATSSSIPYMAPVTMPGGPLALLALLRWRRPEARLLAALACVPQTLLVYEAVPLLLIPKRAGEVVVLLLTSWAAALWLATQAPFAGRLDSLTASGTAIVVCLYLPCLAMVLRRPNEGALPAWLERRIAATRLPPWLAGRTAGEDAAT